MAISSASEKQKPREKVEVLARACRDFEQLADKLRTTTLLADFDILYDMGKYQLVVDEQRRLDEAIKHNGKKLVVEFVLQQRKEEQKHRVSSGKLTGIPEQEMGSLTISPPSKAGSYGLQSTTSRYSEKIQSFPGRYDLQKKIGEGTLGSVYYAEAKKGGSYAVKIIAKHGRHLPQEADVDYLRMLEHDRIVKYMYIIEPDGTNDIHIMMEYMVTGSLKDYLDRNGALYHGLVKAYTKQILEGLDFLHSKNIIHQDLKPANLLLKNDCYVKQIKIADFGSSRFASLKKTRPGQQGRTPKYTDPGVSLGRDVAGRRSDIWSLGVIVIEMYTNRYPWDIEGEHPITVPRILDETPPKILKEDTEKIDDNLVNMAKMMLSPVAQRPYASTLLELPVLEDSPESDDDDFY